ncbi:MAG: tRNA (guanosine(37)-N1)-methyltransferase TrmD [Planctomycetota bacterium]
MSSLRLEILTLFPEMVRTVLGTSMLGIASEKGAVDYRVHDLREWGLGRHRQVDDRPFGGGPGMVLKPEPIFAALESILGAELGSCPILLTSPQGEVWNQARAFEASRAERLVLVAGHYEGFDERILEGLPVTEVSIGDYVLTQGELAALVLADSIVRLRPGVLGDEASAHCDSFDPALGGILDHPHYTRPVEFRGMQVPEVLRSGDHAKIAAWRRERAMEKTRLVRPELLEEDNRRAPIERSERG